MNKKDRKYKCKYCNSIQKRTSNKQWIKSYCETSNRYVHLYLIK